MWIHSSNTYGTWTRTGSVIIAGNTKISNIWFLPSSNSLLSRDDRPISKHLINEAWYTPAQKCIRGCVTAKRRWSGEGGPRILEDALVGDWFSRMNPIALWCVDKDRGGMDIYPQKQHLKWHENMKQHVGLFQKFGIARAQDERQGA